MVNFKYDISEDGICKKVIIQTLYLLKWHALSLNQTEFSIGCSSIRKNVLISDLVIFEVQEGGTENTESCVY